MMTDHCCGAMTRFVEDDETAVVYFRRFREYGISVLDGGESMIVIAFCPWCGTKLPASLRDEWSDAIERLGFEPGDERIPVEFHSDAWWRGRGDAPSTSRG
jgi:hypothetical protein